MKPRSRVGILLIAWWLGAAAPAAAAEVTATWDGGAGTWSAAANWSGDLVPANTGDTTVSVQIDGGKAVASTVTLDLTLGISALTVDAGDALAHSDGATLAVYGGPVTNNGAWTLASTGANTDIAFGGNGTLTGTGTVVMTNEVHNRVYSLGGTLAHAAGHTIRGAGQLLVGVGGMTNAGAVIADQVTLLQVAPNGLGLTNTAVLRAQNGGTLELGGGPFTNTGGVIEALDGSTVRLISGYGGAPIAGGTLRSVGSGVVLTGGNARLTDVTTAGTLRQSDGQLTVVSGTVTNDATWMLQSAGNVTDVALLDAATLQGTGAIVLGNDIHNRVYCNGCSFTNAATHTIRGGGQLLVAVGGMTNAGTVIADQPTLLQVAPSALGLTNTGVLQARAGATLELGGGTFRNTDGLIEALDGSTVRLSSVYGGAPISGGTLRSVGSGVVVIGGSARLTDVTTTGTLRQNDGQAAFVDGTLTNQGTWTLLSAGNLTDVVLADGATLSGAGAIVLGNDFQNRLYCVGGTFTNAATHTIRGAGQVIVGVGGMTNAGAVIADQPTLLQVAPNSLGVTNTGVLRATAGGTLELGGGPFTNTGGVIEALDGSTVRLTGQGGASITGGTLRSVGSGVVLTGGSARLTNVTTAGTLRQSDGQATVVSGTLTNDATWTLLSAGNWTDISVTDGATLRGGGAIVLGDEVHNRVYCNGGTFTQAAGHTIRGAGELLAFVGGMTNAGTIVADRGIALAINPGITFESTGALSATGTGGITSNGGTFRNGGTVVVGSGSRLARIGDYVQRAGATTVEGGTLSATGQIDLQAGTLSGTGAVTGTVRNAADVRPGAPLGALTVTGTYTQTAGGTLTVHLGTAGGVPAAARLGVSGMATLDGTLRIVVATAFPATVGQTFDVVTYGQRAGEFARIDGLSQPNGLVLSASYGASALTLTVVHAAFTPTPTATATVTPTATASPTPVPTSTQRPTPSATAAATPTPSPAAGSPTATGGVTPTPTASASPTATVTPSPPAPLCVGDCNDLREVTVAEILTMVNIALGTVPVTACPASDPNGDGSVTIEEILLAVNNALLGCPAMALSTGGHAVLTTRVPRASRRFASLGTGAQWRSACSSSPRPIRWVRIRSAIASGSRSIAWAAPCAR